MNINFLKIWIRNWIILHLSSSFHRKIFLIKYLKSCCQYGCLGLGLITLYFPPTSPSLLPPSLSNTHTYTHIHTLSFSISLSLSNISSVTSLSEWEVLTLVTLHFCFHIHVTVPSLSLSLDLSIYLSINLSIYLSIYLSIPVVDLCFLCVVNSSRSNISLSSTILHFISIYF